MSWYRIRNRINVVRLLRMTNSEIQYRPETRILASDTIKRLPVYVLKFVSKFDLPATVFIIPFLKKRHLQGRILRAKKSWYSVLVISGELWL